jgi:ribulose kinase
LPGPKDGAAITTLIFNMAFTLGIDYGTNSVRALLVDVANGRELATCVVDYPSGQQGILLDSRDANLARQHPGDYLFGLEKSVRGALEQASQDPAFSADITGCTIEIATSSQACALVSAIAAAVLAGPAKGGYPAIRI